MPSTPVCPSCEVSMEGGFLLDQTHSGTTNARWVEGPPERSIWTGLKLKGRRQLPVYAWRCPRCTEVRLYAPDQ
ncbi:MAG TPA: PF20097 family protein [Longimicrobiaceae bacterium]|nr:PF20097 family protein [Longimicrobiaceae bacterium]